MASHSPSGVAVLVVLLVAGPCVWTVFTLLKRLRRKTDDVEYPHGESRGDAAQGVASNGVDLVATTTTDHDQNGGSAFAGGTKDELPIADYVLTLLGYSIGLGNIWRFPYLVGKWGGGAFVLAYAICLFLVAIPLFLMEMAMGQHTRKNTIDCYKMIHPRWLGLGYGQAFMLFFLLSYYNVLLAYCVIFVGAALQEPLPWSSVSEKGKRFDLSAAELFWRHEVLNAYDGDLEGKGLGPLQPKIALALLVVWLIVFFAIAFGRRTLAKVTWVTVIGPVILMISLLVRAVQLEGSAAGVQFYMGKFDATVFADLRLWAAACGQILFSLGPGFGAGITLSSFTSPKANVFKVCMTVALSNSLFSIVGGFATFSIVGELARLTDRTVAEVARDGGTGLAFIAIAQGMLAFNEAANSMAVIFYVMLLALGLCSTFAILETFIVYSVDFLSARGWRLQRWQVSGGLCIMFFLVGLPYCTRLGIILLDVVDHYCITYMVLLVCFVEAIMFNTGFGWTRLVETVRLATEGSTFAPLGRRIPFSGLWRCCLLISAPAFTGFLFAYNMYMDMAHPYEGLPLEIQVVGWTILALNIGMILSTCVTQRGGKSTLPKLPEKRDQPSSIKPPDDRVGFDSRTRTSNDSQEASFSF